MNTFFNLSSDINIVIDSHLTEQKLITLKKRHRQLFAKYTIHGNPSNNRGILVFLRKNNGCTITNVNCNDDNDTLFFTISMPDMSTIDILSVYAPSKDMPQFWEKAHEIMVTGQSQHKIIIGDFNCTLNHNTDQQGYKTDPHTKSRKIINNLLEQELYIDSFRHLNPEKKSYTFRTKDGKKRGRLDYGLISPTLTPHLKEVKHIAHHYDNTDHSTISLEIDITKSEIGQGIFRCPPNIHNDLDFQILIKNTIKKPSSHAKPKHKKMIFMRHCLTPE